MIDPSSMRVRKNDTGHMLSVTHSRGTPPSLAIVAYMAVPREGGSRRGDRRALRPMALQGRLQVHVKPRWPPPDRGPERRPPRGFSVGTGGLRL